MHIDGIASDVGLVRRLLEAQHPSFADRAIERVASTGTDNALYRLGADAVARLPLRPSATRSHDDENRWLPVLAERLPLPIPVPLAIGTPTDEFPWPWSIYPWFVGTDGTELALDGAAQDRLAISLAAFITALGAIDSTGGPAASSPYGRGVPLDVRDDFTREAIAASAEFVDVSAVTEAWDDALTAAPWDGPAVWVHGDIAAGNLLFEDDVLSAVIDFGAMATGDPAVDLLVAWELFDAPARATFRTEMAADDAAWRRGRGWALSTAIHGIPYYRDTNRFMIQQSLRKIDEVLTDLSF